MHHLHSVLTVEYDDCEDGEVEEDAGPRGGVDHGEDDGDHEYDDLDRQRPHDARRQRPSVKTPMTFMSQPYHLIRRFSGQWLRGLGYAFEKEQSNCCD